MSIKYSKSLEYDDYIKSVEVLVCFSLKGVWCEKSTGVRLQLDTQMRLMIESCACLLDSMSGLVQANDS